MDRLREAMLRETVLHARDNSAYYRELLRDRPADPLEAFRSTPVTNKMDIVSSDLKREVPAAPGEVRLTGSTSGSSGQPFTFEIDDLLPSRHDAQRAYVYLRAGLPRKARILEIVPGQRLQLIPDLTYPTFKRFVVGYAHENLAGYITAVRPELLYGNRSHLLQVADECQEQNVSISIPYVCSSSETVLERDKERLEEAFGCEIFEVYGSAEASNIAFYTPDDPLWAILEPRVWVEVLDENRMPVAPGEVGEIVVTTLTERTAPFLRYATGDLATVAQGDGSGRSGLKLASLDGRSSDSLVRSDGRKVAFWAISTPRFWGRDDIASQVSRWQIHQSPDRSLAIRVELIDRTQLERLRPEIEEFVLSVVGQLPVSVVAAEQIHDPSNGKFRAVTSEA
jgi:phenylacetate-CoA ligase